MNRKINLLLFLIFFAGTTKTKFYDHAFEKLVLGCSVASFLIDAPSAASTVYFSGLIAGFASTSIPRAVLDGIAIKNMFDVITELNINKRRLVYSMFGSVALSYFWAPATKEIVKEEGCGEATKMTYTVYHALDTLIFIACIKPFVFNQG